MKTNDIVDAGGAERLAIEELLERLERWDDSTSVHVRTVGSWSRRLAQTLGLPSAQVRYVETCGVLHDVGKLFTPTNILTKAGVLTTKEWERMRAHAAEGADLLETIPVLREYASVVRSHHERVDGRGYPDRLAADAIPFEARIVAIADTFDAMLADRPYRTPLAPTAAIAELRRCAGEQFDAELVEAFASILQPVRRIVVPNVRYA